MKKTRWIPFMITLIFVSGVVGQYLGASTQAERHNALIEARDAIQTTIAVVNADIGIVAHDGTGTQNFSAAIIDTLDRNFVLVSPAMALSGYASGLYGAIVTFPSNVSERVLSFNAQNPEHVRLEFQINPNMSESSFIETHNRIMELQSAINTTIAYTYVSSIFEQFHTAQDEIHRVFLNDTAQLTALDIVNMESFTADLRLDALPSIPFQPNAPVTSHFMVSVTDFARNVSDMYLNSFQAATEDYLYMRRNVMALTDDFPRQEREWMRELEDWQRVFDQFGRDLSRYSDNVRGHQANLEGWHERATTWNDDLVEYQNDLISWHNGVSEWNQYLRILQQQNDNWYTRAYGWNTDLRHHHQYLVSWRVDTLNSVSRHEANAATWAAGTYAWHEGLYYWQTDLEYWYEDLDYWYAYTYYWFNSIQDELYAIEYDIFKPLLNDITRFNSDVELLTKWHTAQEGYADELLGLAVSYNYHVYDLNAMYITLYNWNAGLSNFTPNMQAQTYSLQTQTSYLHGHVTSLSSQLGALLPMLDALYDVPGFEYILYDITQAVTDASIAIYDVAHSIVDVEQSIYEVDWYVPGIGDNIPQLTLIQLPAWVNGVADYERISLPPTIESYFPENGFPLTHLELSEHTLLTPSPYYGRQVPARVEEPPPKLTSYDLPQAPVLQTIQPGEPPVSNRAEPDALARPSIARPGNLAVLDVEQPVNPTVGAPPRPHDFWYSLNDMHHQLNSFSIGRYLTPEYRMEIQRMLWEYERYMSEVRADLAEQFNYNVSMLTYVRAGYVDFLASLRVDAMQAEADTIEQLNNTIEAFAASVETTSIDTRDRLYTFANMMPESRTPTGLNSELARFTVAPVEFISYQPRDTMDFRMEVEPATETFVSFIWISLAVLLGVLILTIASYLIPERKKSGVVKNGTVFAKPVVGHLD